jgi:hypothetical protein
MRSLVTLVLLGTFGCSGGETPEPDPATANPETVTEPEAVAAPERTERPEPVPEGDSDTPAPPEGEAEGDLCTRARACCRAYVTAIPSARRPLEERGCTEMDAVLGAAGEAADDVCEAAIGGWRQSLQLTGIEVPSDCR